MNVHQYVFFLSLFSTPEKRLLATGVGRVRPEGERYSGQLHRADVLEKFQGVSSLPLLALSGRRVDHSIGEYSSEPCLFRCSGNVLHVKIHVNETGGSSSRHLHRPKQPAIVAHFPGESFLERPDLFFQPLLKFKIVSVSPKESHGKMRMGVDQSWNQHFASTVYNFVFP